MRENYERLDVPDPAGGYTTYYVERNGTRIRFGQRVSGQDFALVGVILEGEGLAPDEKFLRERRLRIEYRTQWEAFVGKILDPVIKEETTPHHKGQMTKAKNLIRDEILPAQIRPSDFDDFIWWIAQGKRPIEGLGAYGKRFLDSALKRAGIGASFPGEE